MCLGPGQANSHLPIRRIHSVNGMWLPHARQAGIWKQACTPGLPISHPLMHEYADAAKGTWDDGDDGGVGHT